MKMWIFADRIFGMLLKDGNHRYQEIKRIRDECNGRFIPVAE